MDLPEPSLYKDAHQDNAANFPDITMDRVKDYLSLFHKDFEEKCVEFYEERYLRCFRVCQQTESNVTFLCAIMWAEMKKAGTYRVDISVDSDGVIDEAQCECGAGQGPNAHCKHVATVLYAATLFKLNKTVISELTCTQKLQTFHQAKPHQGSPLLATNLQAIRKSDRNLCYDPRGRQYKSDPAYKDYFRNTVLNYSGSSRMPVRQLYAPANIPAVFHDHHYMEKSMEDHFIDCELHVTDTDIESIESSTRKQAASTQWREERKKRVTSSVFGTVCKATDRRDMEALANSICTPKELRTPAILHGIKYEPVAVQKFEQSENVQTQPCGLFVSKSHPYLAASPDRIIDSDTLLEVKCPFSSREKNITPVTVPYLVSTNEGMTLDPKHDYYYQVQGQMYCSGRKMCKFLVFTQKDMKVLPIKYDETFVSAMIKKLQKFYNEHFRSVLINNYLYKNYHDYQFN